MEDIKSSLRNAIVARPASIGFFQGKTLIKNDLSIAKDSVDFVFEDEMYRYLADLRYEEDATTTISALEEKAHLYSAQQRMDLTRIKKVLLIDERTYERGKKEIETEATKKGVQVLAYNVKSILDASGIGGPGKEGSIEPTGTLTPEDLEKLFKYFTPQIDAPLSLLENAEEGSVILGRSSDDQNKYKNKGLLYVGRICEKHEGYFGRTVMVDAIQPHKIFICGKTGSGKSYTMGVIAEELANLDIGIGVVIIDPMGVFWSMKFPRSETEADVPKSWKLEPRGFENVKVFVPVGFKNRFPKNTYDAAFAVRPNELAAEDWCNTFGVDIYESPQGGLICDILTRLKQGYEAEINGVKKSFEPNENFSLEDMTNCAQHCADFTKKYRSDSVRALVMHLETAGNWGIFSSEATQIQSLSIANQVSVVDVSLLPDYSRALITGILARKILDERTKYVRYAKAAGVGKDDAERQDEVEEIPVTWLMVDEAHILVPSKGKTAASEPLVEYAKRGRMPGCALVLATQQPGATDDRILSQVDVLMTHNLSFSDDISAYRARSPANLPGELAEQGFIRRLPIGVAVVGDQSSQTERAFVVFIRPRISEHAGRIIPPGPPKPRGVPQDPQETSEKKKTEKSATETPSFAPQIPTLSIPPFLAADYLTRLIQYRLSEFLERDRIRKMRKQSNIVLPELKREILGKIIGDLEKQGLSLKEIQQMDGTPVLLMFSEETRLAVAICLTEKETVMSYAISTIAEKDLVTLLDYFDKLKTQISG
jgi:hypothetical protein